jgi:hypothetical protein
LVSPLNRQRRGKSKLPLELLFIVTTRQLNVLANAEQAYQFSVE